MLTAINWDEVLQNIVLWLSTSGLKLLVGFIAMGILFKIINFFAKLIKKNLEKKQKEKTLIVIVNATIRKGFKILVILIFLAFVGVDTAGIGAIISSVGIALGLALQGSLSNFAGGLVIALMRPFKIGDFIETQGFIGTVDHITMFYTHLLTPDNKVVMLPNGQLSNGNIVNHTKKDMRKVEMRIPIHYKQDVEKVRRIIFDICLNNPLTLKTTSPFINVAEYKENAIIILLRVWTKTSDYWELHFKMLEDVKKRFDEEKILIPHQQLDIYLNEANKMP